MDFSQLKLEAKQIDCKKLDMALSYDCSKLF